MPGDLFALFCPHLSCQMDSVASVSRILVQFEFPLSLRMFSVCSSYGHEPRHFGLSAKSLDTEDLARQLLIRAQQCMERQSDNSHSE